MSGVEKRISKVIEEVRDICREVRVVSDNRIVIKVNYEKIREVAEKLKKEGFDHVKGVTGVDYPGRNEIEVIYYVSSYLNSDLSKIIVEVKISTSRENPVIPSLIDIWPSSEYLERETFEMLGVIFDGHPRLTNLLLPEEFKGVYPLRKDFKMSEEGIVA